MTFSSFLREFIKSFLAPLPLLWLLLIVTLILYWFGKKKFSGYVFSLSLLWFFLISTPFLPKKLLTTLEKQYPPFQLVIEKVTPDSSKNSKVHILVLGSGYQSDDRLSYCARLNPSGLARIAEAIRLQRLIPGSILIFSGYAGNQRLSQAQVSALAAVELGIDSTIIMTLNESWNTKTEAAEYFKRFGSANNLYLVTDATHMPRAIRLFRDAGLNPIPVPTNFNIKKNSTPMGLTEYFPSNGKIRFMEIVCQEYLGLLWANLGGN